MYREGSRLSQNFQRRGSRTELQTEPEVTQVGTETIGLLLALLKSTRAWNEELKDFGRDSHRFSQHLGWDMLIATALDESLWPDWVQHCRNGATEGTSHLIPS